MQRRIQTEPVLKWKDSLQRRHLPRPYLLHTLQWLQGKLRHPPRELWIHSTDAIMLNREVSARERDGVD